MDEPGRAPDGPAAPWDRGAGHALAYLTAWGLLFAVGLVLGPLLRADRQIDPAGLDHRVASWAVAQRGDWPALTPILRGVTRIGDPDVGFGIVLASAVLLFLLHREGAPGIRRGDWLFWIVVVASSRLLSVALKAWFQRARPPEVFRLVVEGSYSFPSGHSVSTAASFAVGAILLARALRNHPAWRVILVGLCPVLIVLIAASRVWLGVHYLTDVVGGVLLGLGWAVAACSIHYDRLGRWPWRRAGSGAGGARASASTPPPRP